MKPHGDSAPYDVVVDNGRRLLRVQVKSVAKRHRDSYEINAGRGRFIKRAYTCAEIDFLAAWIVPDDTWFIIPVAALRCRKTLRLSRSGHFLGYREAWTLLGLPRLDRLWKSSDPRVVQAFRPAVCG
jgi:hypothetical protein